jgi:hypothetical protein
MRFMMFSPLDCRVIPERVVGVDRRWAEGNRLRRWDRQVGPVRERGGAGAVGLQQANYPEILMPSDAVDKLKADHDRVEGLFRKLKDAGEEETRTTGVHVCNLVKIHMTLEEELFYPALRGQAEADEDKLDEGLVEHDAGKLLINDVLADPAQDKAAAKLQVLGEQMVHHHKEEEEDGGIFDQARKAGIDLVAMREAMEQREAQLRAELKAGDLPAAEMNFVEVDATPE